IQTKVSDYLNTYPQSLAVTSSGTFPKPEPIPGPPPASLPLLPPSILAAPRPPKSPREAGCDTWKPTFFPRFRRDATAAFVRCAYAPSCLHRWSWQFRPAPLQYAGPESLAHASRGQSEIYPACAIPSADARTASHTARHRSSRFLSGAP